MADPSIYDYPLYYDILFGWERDGEAERYASIIEGCGVARGERVLEVGCGTGQVGLRLAAAGWQVTGLDWSAGMLAFFAGRAEEEGLDVETLEADMTAFEWGAGGSSLAAALCALNTLGLLRDEEAVVTHLRVMGAALASGAPYVLDLTVGIASGPESVEDRWGYRRDEIEVRAEPGAITVVDPDLREELWLTWGPPNWEYSPDAWARMVGESGAFSIEAVYPESGHDENGVSVFAEQSAAGIEPGRSLVVLRRD